MDLYILKKLSLATLYNNFWPQKREKWGEEENKTFLFQFRLIAHRGWLGHAMRVYTKENHCFFAPPPPKKTKPLLKKFVDVC